MRFGAAGAIAAGLCAACGAERCDGPPAHVTETVRAHVTTATPDRLDSIVGDARIVGLGEATHGAHELFAWKRDAFAWLVEHKGFRAIAFELPRDDATAVEAYVVDGRGSARSALERFHYWTWQTEEVLGLVEWMRAWNAPRPPLDRVHFYGMDADANPDFDFDARDLAMANAIEALGGMKVAIWAHNAHVGTELGRLTSAGAHLRRAHGSGYVAIGLLFGSGELNARVDGVVRHCFLGEAPPTDATTPIFRTGMPMALLDLRTLPASARAWFETPHPVRDVGVRFSDETSSTPSQALAPRYDAVVYVATTTASHLLDRR